MTSLLEIKGLTVRHGAITAVDDVSLVVNPGEAVALIGANGAGKTTLLQTIMGLVKPIAGEIRIDDTPLDRQPVSARSRLGLGYSPERRRVFPELTVLETLTLSSRRHGGELAAKISEMFDLFPPLAGRQNVPGGQLSGGEQQMLAVARALMTEPKLLLLDEPSLGLSPLLAEQVMARIRDIAARGAAVLLAEQNAGQALAVADRAYVMRLGRIVGEGSAADLQADQGLSATLLGRLTPA
jgi:branched-chain amino acid transport system ATP-binding protein